MENINDLPVEILTRIFDFLTISDRKHVSRVCRLWHNILHCVRFQRQCRLVFDSTFEEQLSDLEKRILRSCRNLSITHWDDTDDDDYDDDDEDEQLEKEVIVQFKYLFKPSPERNVTDLLFEESLPLESLEINTTFDSCRDIIEDRLPQLEQLRELFLSFDQNRNPNSPKSHPGIWVLQHKNLETLRIGLSYEIDAFRIEAPSLTYLDIQPKCRWSMEIVETYCRQLRTLKLRFQHVEYMESFLSLPFPSLTHLQVRMYDDKEIQMRYARNRNRIVDAERDEQFVRDMPKLRKLLLESNLLFFRIGVLLAKCNHQLEELTLEEQQIDYAQLKVVESLPKLKSFTLFRCEVLMPSPALPSLNMPHLDKLELFYNESSIVFNEGLSGLKSLKISLWTEKNHKVLYKICKNLPNLEHLEVLANTKLVNTCLRYLHRLTNLRSLKLDNSEPSTLLWQHCPVVPSIQRVVFYNCTLTSDTLLPVARLFPNMRELFIDRCYFKKGFAEGKSESDSEGDGDESDSERKNDNKYLNADRVRQLFPLCRVSCKESSFYWHRYQ
ncbi:uncharacterized protein LOC109422268 [Aedes albopictus]|uniref:F-box domain-containing protein n=1 Tax=Aedes albopictus TaxID=7160 RepID=A0ABM1Z6Y9_AEDAL|nr:uncharacterized protein LOC109422268 [Aedes albopictus]